MKILLLLALLTVPLIAANTIKKPAAAARSVAPKDHSVTVTAAARSAVEAYLKSRDRMSPAQYVTIKSIKTEAMAGWAGRYVSSGTAEVYIPGASSGKQQRTFNAFATVSDTGAITVTEVSVN